MAFFSSGGEVLTFHTASSASAFGYKIAAHPFSPSSVPLPSLTSLTSLQPARRKRLAGSNVAFRCPKPS